jgi:hypothetical protein
LGLLSAGFLLAGERAEPPVSRQIPGRAATAYDTGQVGCHGQPAALAEPEAFRAWLTPLYGQEWVVYAKPPFGGPQQVLKYLARYAHRAAISNGRLVSLDEDRVTFRYKDYADGRRHKTMALSAHEFIRRFLQHMLPSGFVKIRHYGLLANRYQPARVPSPTVGGDPGHLADGCQPGWRMWRWRAPLASLRH